METKLDLIKSAIILHPSGSRPFGNAASQIVQCEPARARPTTILSFSFWGDLDVLGKRPAALAGWLLRCSGGRSDRPFRSEETKRGASEASLSSAGGTAGIGEFMHRKHCCHQPKIRHLGISLMCYSVRRPGDAT